MKAYCVIIAAFFAAAIALYIQNEKIKSQNKKIAELEQESSQLKQSNQLFKNANDNLVRQYEQIQAQAEIANKAKDEADRKSYQISKKIKQLQINDNCANSNIPDDVVRLQLEAIAETNRKFTTPKS